MLIQLTKPEAQIGHKSGNACKTLLMIIQFPQLHYLATFVLCTISGGEKIPYASTIYFSLKDFQGS